MNPYKWVEDRIISHLPRIHCSSSLIFLKHMKEPLEKKSFQTSKKDIMKFICTVLNEDEITKGKNLRWLQLGIILTVWHRN